MRRRRRTGRPSFLDRLRRKQARQRRNRLGHLTPANEVIRWHHRSLLMNDEVRVKIVEARTADAFEVLQPAPQDSRKYEKAYVRRMAKEFGWTIQTKSGAKQKRSTKTSRARPKIAVGFQGYRSTPSPREDLCMADARDRRSRLSLAIFLPLTHHFRTPLDHNPAAV